jgi:hypothetical protein
MGRAMQTSFFASPVRRERQTLVFERRVRESEKGKGTFASD